MTELSIELQDNEWPFEYTDHDRSIARAICIDEDGAFYFVRINRDDHFGKATLIETSGGGIEEGEDWARRLKSSARSEQSATTITWSTATT